MCKTLVFAPWLFTWYGRTEVPGLRVALASLALAASEWNSYLAHADT